MFCCEYNCIYNDCEQCGLYNVSFDEAGDCMDYEPFYIDESDEDDA